jgi:hypothetical protein
MRFYRGLRARLPQALDLPDHTLWLALGGLEIGQLARPLSPAIAFMQLVRVSNRPRKVV